MGEGANMEMLLNGGGAEERAFELLRQAFGPTAEFRKDQLEAIQAVVEGQNTIVVEKTGWGKSLVYFIATKIMRERGAGPAIIISPLLALMDNQIDAAQRFGVNAVTINSSNYKRWPDIYDNIDSYDALIVSPERLATEKFMESVASIRDIRLVVVDEVHSISDWGHDFRPDYQRISKLIEGFPRNVTVLGTTATANDRVLADVKAQMGNDIQILRGDLMRENLAIQVNPEQTREQRLAWLAQALTENEKLCQGQGIIYCLTHSDCEAVARYLSDKGVSILPYYSGMERNADGSDKAQANLASFVDGKTRILAATIKLGMGYDKSDIRFVIHFQLPQNLIAYYQQIGRAGRDGLPSLAILLHGQEDEETLRYFIQTALASPDLLSDIVDLARKGVSRTELLATFNVKLAKLNEALKYLQIHDFIYAGKKDGRSCYYSNAMAHFDKQKERSRQESLTRIRIAEHNDLLKYLESKDCYMSHIAAELDAPDAQESCGICANCRQGLIVPVDINQQVLSDATQYLGNRHGRIEPRKRWAANVAIRKELLMQPGWTLCADYYSSAGQRIREEKHSIGSFSPEIVAKSAEYLRSTIPNAGIDCIVPIPSLRRPTLVPDLARNLAKALGVPYVEALMRIRDAVEQKTLLNSAQQEANVRESLALTGEPIAAKRILLVDDTVDSRWTLTVAAAMLLDAGAMSVSPFALVRTGGGD
ncbi:MAG: RecQ family ATP-dependent DNA helicase [Coriobacteriales bacterium]|nr:RecQ family ATP-dependent DNA helicase [Coriobacteriales bacterium]